MIENVASFLGIVFAILMMTKRYPVEKLESTSESADLVVLRKKYGLKYALLVLINLFWGILMLLGGLLVASEIEINRGIGLGLGFVGSIIFPFLLPKILKRLFGEEWFGGFQLFLNKSYGFDFFNLLKYLIKIVCLFGIILIGLSKFTNGKNDILII